MKLTILDLFTDVKHEVESGYEPYAFTDGNWSCDCNRSAMCGFHPEPRCSCERFLIVGSDHPEFNYDEWNMDYSDASLEAHRP